METLDIDFEEFIYQKEINIGFFNYDEGQFREMINSLSQSSFSKKFILRQNILYFNEYIRAVFEEKKELKNEIIEEDDEEIEKENDKDKFLININNCKIVEKMEGIYGDFIKEKLDFYFIFNGEMIDKKFMDEICEYSKQNYILFKMGKNINKDIIPSDKYSTNQYDYFEVNKDDIAKYGNKSNVLIFTDFLLDLKNKFDMYKIFQNYSIEKSIISFKDYLYNFNKYNKIKEENKLVELFNKFERFSFNNDYADVTIILIQIMTMNKNILNKNFTFNAKTLKCGFCLNKLNECEFDNDSKCFLCQRCKYTKDNYPKDFK